MTSDTHSASQLTHFLYRSNSRQDLSDDDLRDIVREARNRNRDLEITGCLHFEDGLFFQWLEGPRDSLDLVINLIRQDPRHEDFTELSYGPLDRRRFADWSLRSTSRNDGSLLDWFASNNVSTIDRGVYVGSVTTFLMSAIF